MAMSEPITPELRDAFRSALGVFNNWADQHPKTQASYEGRFVEIETVFEEATAFTENVDADCYQTVLNWAEKFSSGEDALGHDCTCPADKS
jgi:hypothetical protein